MLRKEKFRDPLQKPEVVVCPDFASYQQTGEELAAQGFHFDRNISASEVDATLAFYTDDDEIEEVKLTSAFTQAKFGKDGLTSEALSGMVGVWVKTK